MTGVTPGVRTHSVRSVVVEMDGGDVLECRRCGERWHPADLADVAIHVDDLERMLCGTCAPDPGSEANP